MKKILLTCCLFFYTGHQIINAQILISEDFEDTTVDYIVRSETESSTSATSSNAVEGVEGSENDYFGRVRLSDLTRPDEPVLINNIQPNQNSFFFGVNDQDGLSGRPNFDLPTLNWFNLDVSGLTQINVSALFAEDDDDASGGESWDPNSSIRFEYSFDNITWSKFFAIESSSGTVNGTMPLIDTDLDGIGDGAEITSTFQEFSSNFDTMGNPSVSIRIVFEGTNGNDEDIAIDNFLIESACTVSAPSPVINPEPIDGAPNVVLGANNSLNFSWENGAGDPGTSYTLNIGTTSPDDIPISNFLNGSSIEPLANNTTYFWRVDATNCAGTTLGTIWSFTTGETCAVSVPDQVVSPTTPIDGEIDVPINFGSSNNIGPFEWVPATSGDPADSFNINIGLTPAGNDIGSLADFANGNFINFNWQSNTTYYWSIDAVNCAGVTSGPVWSFTTENCSLNAPNPVINPGPLDGATGVSIADGGALVFSWENATTGDLATSFTLNIGLANPPNIPFPNFANSNQLSGQISGLTENTTYYWSIDAVNCAGTTPGPIWSFTTGEICAVSVPDQVVSPVTPIDGEIDVPINFGGPNNIVPFEWVPATSGDPADSFNINIGLTTAGNDIASLTNFANGNSINFNWQPNTTYYWSIDAVNCAGVTSGPVWSFTTEDCSLNAPNPVINPDPLNGATGVSIADGGVLTFSWENATTGDPATAFNLNIGTVNPPDIPFSNFANSNQLSGQISGLAENTTYYWSIDAVNCTGTTPGLIWSFTTGETLSTENNDLESFKVYPNPTKGILNIDTTLDIDAINIYNLVGQNVATFNKNNIINNSINLSELSKGLYIIRISVGDKTKTYKITKE